MTSFELHEQIRKALYEDLTDRPGATVGRGSSKADGLVFTIRIVGGTRHTLEIRASALLQAENQGVDGLMEELRHREWVAWIRAEGCLFVTLGTTNNYVVGSCREPIPSPA